MNKRWTLAAAVALLVAFQVNGSASSSRQAILDKVIDLAEHDALNASRVDWATTARTANGILQQDDSDAGLTASVRYVLSKLSDHHSLYRPPVVPASQSTATIPQAAMPIASTATSPAGTPIVRMGPWAGRDAAAAAAAATIVRQALVSALAPRSCGVIVDFSANSGGNMWPMVVGLLPLYSEGMLGAFEARDHQRTSIVSTGDGLLVGGTRLYLNQPGLARPGVLPARVAIIIGPRTASSGEITALLFKGQPNARFFGHDTAGIPTANRSYVLDNGASLALTTAITLDRDGNPHAEAIRPDVVTDDPVSAADSWIEAACSRRHAH